MKNYPSPIFNTKTEGDTKSFKLEDPVERRRYFEHKAGAEIEKLRDYLRVNTFMAFLMGKKNGGKGTYIKLFMEAIGSENVAHISIGDIVRDVHAALSDEKEKAALFDFLKIRYRGFITLEKIADIIEGRDTKTLLPTEVILALTEREITNCGRKAVFIDGFPRNLDQISSSLYFRALMGYRDDPDFFVFIDVPESIIDERMKHRVICPECKTPRNPKLLRTKEVGYDEETRKFYLKCDNPACPKIGARMISKEGDELGIEAIRDRIEMDDKIIRTLVDVQGVPKIFLRNSIPVATADDYVDKYEITPGYRYSWEETAKMVNVTEEPWTVKDENGEPSYSLLPAAVVLSLIKQTVKVLGL